MQISIHVTPNSYGMYAPDQTYSDSTVLVAPVSHRHVSEPHDAKKKLNHWNQHTTPRCGAATGKLKAKSRMLSMASTSPVMAIVE
jgi:hypothetical protein